MPAKTIQEVLRENTERWMALAGVVGTALGEFEGQPCIKVFAAEKTPELLAEIPESVEGHRVIVEETGEFRAL